MSDVLTRIEGHAGRITLNRPKALNALTYDMCMSIEAAIDDWRDNHAVKLIIIDAEGEKAFCAGGDIADIYAAGKREEFDYPRKFWRPPNPVTGSASPSVLLDFKTELLPRTVSAS